MCDPITLGIMAAGTLASVAGGGISQREQTDNNTRIADARNKALSDTNARNMERAAQSREALSKQLSATTGQAADQGLQDKQQQAVQAIQGNMAPSVDEPSLDGNAPMVAKSGLGKAISDAAAKSKAKGAAQGNLLGYTTLGRDNAMGDQNLGTSINTNNNFVRGENEMLPSIMDYEQIKANKPSSGLGELLSGLGSAASGYAGKRAGASGFSM
ncbi:MAG: hypothetical protein ABJA10_06690 [Aestuariivirga sp.]